MSEIKTLPEIQKEFRRLNANSLTSKKGNLTYLTWSSAWEELIKIFPEATYEVKKFDKGLPFVHDEMTGYMVFTELTICGVTREMWLPVMDGANRALKSKTYKVYGKDVAVASMFDVNKTIMRCLVKNIAMFNLGLYIYAGEDLPEAPKVMDGKRFEGAIEALKANKTTKEAISAFDLTHEQAVELDAVEIPESVADKLKSSVNK